MRRVILIGTMALLVALPGVAQRTGGSAGVASSFIILSGTGGACTNGQVGYYSGSFYGCAGSAWVGFSAGGASSGTNLIQVSNGSGGFISNAGLRADTTNGYLGIRNDSSAPTVPLDMTWGALARTTSNFNLAQFTCNASSTVSAPGTFQCLNNDMTLTGSDGAFTDHNPIPYYSQVLDERTPTAASTVDHEMDGVFREYFNGGNNLTCTECNGIYITAGSDFPAVTSGTGGTATLMNGIHIDAGDITGYGTILQWDGVEIGYPSATDGKAALGNVSGVLMQDPTSGASHGTGSGCVAAFAIGGNCTTAAGKFSIYSDTTAPITMLGSIAVGSLTAPSAGIACDCEGEVDTAAISGTSPAIGFRDSSAGSVRTWINKPARAIGHLKLPSDAGTFSSEAGAYDSATAITGNLTAQTLFAFPDSNSRFFRLVVYGVCTSSVAGSTVTINFAYTDEQQAQTVSSSAQTCAAAGDILTFTAPAYANTASVKVSTTTASSPVYLLHARLELLGPDTFGSN